MCFAVQLRLLCEACVLQGLRCQIGVSHDHLQQLDSGTNIVPSDVDFLDLEISGV